MTVWPAFEQFHDHEKHLWIPQDHIETVNGIDIKIGYTVNHIRSRQDFLQHDDFKQWLDDRGFVYDERRAHLEVDAWPAFKQFHKREKHLRIPVSHIENVGWIDIKIGRTVNMSLR